MNIGLHEIDNMKNNNSIVIKILINFDLELSILRL